MRAKIIIPNLLAVILLGMGAYFYLHNSLQAQTNERMKKELRVVSALFLRSEQLRGHEQLADVLRLSMVRTVSDVFSKLEMDKREGESVSNYESRIGHAWFKKAVQAVETVAVRLEHNGRKPAIVFVTDRNGVVIARNTTPNACPTGRNVAQAMSVVQSALDGEASNSIWFADTSPLGKDIHQEKQICSLLKTGLLEISAVPIWNTDDQVAGVLAVGYEVSNGMAAEKSKSLGMQLAVLQAKEVYSTSFTTDTAREDLNKGLRQPGVQTKLSHIYLNGNTSKFFSLEVEGRSFLAVAAPVPNVAKKDKTAFIFMSSVQNASSFFASLWIVAAMFFAIAMGVIVIGYMLGNYFMKPIVAIEEGLLKIINGEYDYRFEVESEEVGGLSYRINQLVNVLTDEEEPLDDDQLEEEENS